MEKEGEARREDKQFSVSHAALPTLSHMVEYITLTHCR
jgi:hypothetical protein